LYVLVHIYLRPLFSSCDSFDMSVPVRRVILCSLYKTMRIDGQSEIMHSSYLSKKWFDTAVGASGPCQKGFRIQNEASASQKFFAVMLAPEHDPASQVNVSMSQCKPVSLSYFAQ